MPPIQDITEGPAWKAIGDRLLKPCYLRREDNNPKKIGLGKKEQMLVNISL
jgi:hypothetical protein